MGMADQLREKKSPELAYSVMDKPLVSIKCLVYNHAPFLRQCLDGFVMQKTNFRFEAIVHDDASTDGSAGIIREYAEKYPDIIKPIYENENQYSKRDGSLNRILNKHLTGKYIAFCEGDDYWTDPCKLQKQVDFMETHPDFAVCTHDCRRLYEPAGTFGEQTFYAGIFQKSAPKLTDYLKYTYLHTHTRTHAHTSEPAGYLIYTLEDNFKFWYTQPLTALFRNGDYLAQIPVWEYPYFRDIVLYYYVLRQGKGALMPDVMGVYRIQPCGVYSKSSEKERLSIARECYLGIFRVERDRRPLAGVCRVERSLVYALRRTDGAGAALREMWSFLSMVPLCTYLRFLFGFAAHSFRKVFSFRSIGM